MSRRVRQNEASVSLFPFLAVLICAMGALIVLLVIVVQQAGGKAASETPLPPPAEVAYDDQRRADLELQHEDLAWQAKVLAESREETIRRLREQQTELSMIEDQSRNLKVQLDRLFEESQRLENVKSNELTANNDVRQRQAKLQSEILAAQTRLQQLQQEQKDREKRFALVPYAGENGTTRRPIYVECLPDAVVIQPEGIRLEENDFIPPFDDDNVLAVALRATREYLVNNGLLRTSSEAYPLLVVRPHGETAYAICRLLLHDWDDDFGYELVADDVQVTYPAADPSLQSLLQQTVEEARWRLSQRVRRQPEQLVLSVTPGQGGFVREGQHKFGRGGKSSRITTGKSGGDGNASSPGGFDATTQNARNMNSSVPRPSLPAASGGDFVGTGSAAQSAAGQLPGEPVTGGAPYPAGNTAYQSGPNGNSSAPSARMNGGGSSGRQSPSGSTTNSTSMMSDTSSAPETQVDSIAATQGANWALPGAAHGAIGIHRPVRIRCDGDQLQLLPEPGTAEQLITISTQNGIESAVHGLVTALWSRIDSWGIAGSGTYWKPTIEAEVTPTGEPRYQEVAQLMDDSGIVVSRR